MMTERSRENVRLRRSFKEEIMKVLLLNGSPNKNGCTFTALSEAAKALNECGIETEIFQIGKKPVPGCIACGSCAKTGKCAFDDAVNEFVSKAAEADGFIIGSPVYYSGVNGSLMSLLDRAFYSSPSYPDDPFRFKPAAAVVSARRAGTTSAIDQINKYFMIREMPIISSRYWTMVHGNTPEQVMQDEEGLQVMRVLGRNMAWFLRLVEAGRKAGVKLPEQEDVRVFTNFIR